MLRPVRTVRVTTTAELDAALATADQVIVEGDDELLSYAASKAAGDPDNSVSVEIGEHSVAVAGVLASAVESTIGSTKVGPAKALDPDIRNVRQYDETEQARKAAAPPPATVFVPRRTRWVPLLALLLVLVALGGGGLWLYSPVAGIGGPSVEGKSASQAPVAVQPIPPALQSPPQLDQRQPEGADGAELRPATYTQGPGGLENPNPPSAALENGFWPNLPSLLWPLVAIVAIVALFLITWRAISSGSNVTISWKVTDKVAGRVVITKVRERTSRPVKAAA